MVQDAGHGYGQWLLRSRWHRVLPSYILGWVRWVWTRPLPRVELFWSIWERSLYSAPSLSLFRSLPGSLLFPSPSCGFPAGLPRAVSTPSLWSPILRQISRGESHHSPLAPLRPRPRAWLVWQTSPPQRGKGWVWVIRRRRLQGRREGEVSWILWKISPHGSKINRDSTIHSHSFTISGSS